MFSKKQFILSISKNHVRVGHVICRRGECHVDGVQSVHWTQDTLLGILQNIHKETGGHIRLVLDDDLAYITSFPFEKNTIYDRERIKQEAQKRIPENLDDVPWDFVHISTRIGKMKSVFHKGAQVVAVTRFFLEHIAPVLSEASFSVDVLETESCALARQIGMHEKPVLAMRENQYNTLYIIVEHGVVLMAEKVSGPIRKNSIDTFLTFAKHRWDVDIHDLIVSNMTDTDLHDALVEQGFLIEDVKLDAMVGITKKMDINGKDEDVLNVNLLPEDVGRSHWILPSGEWVKLIVGIVCLAAAGFVLRNYYMSHSPSNERKSGVVSDVSAPVLDTPAVEENINRTSDGEFRSYPEAQEESKIERQLSEYAITVLNGSGKKGEASLFRDVLEKQGFSVGHIDNADKNSYKLTVVRAKASVSVDVVSKIKSSVSLVYVLSDEGDVLDEQNENDMIIIIGSERVSEGDVPGKQIL